MKKPWKGKSVDAWITFIAAVLGIAALAGGVALTLARNSGGNDSPTPRVDRLSSTSTPTTPGSKPLAIGSVAKVGSDYSVAVTEVTRYEGTLGPFIAAEIKTTFKGKGNGDPQDDLAAKYTRASHTADTTDESVCEADFGAPDLSDLSPASRSTLASGQTRTYVVCMALPTEKVDDGSVLIEASSGDDQAFWTTAGATTKALPTPKPPPAPAGPTISAADRKEALHDIKKQLKKSKKFKKFIDEQIDIAEDTEGFKKKKLKKLKKARDKIEKVIDQLETTKDQLE